MHTTSAEMRFQMRMAKSITVLAGTFFWFGSISLNAAVYQYHPNAVVTLGSTFDPVDLSAAHRDCIEYDYEYSLDAARDQAVPPPPGNSVYSGETAFSITQLRSQRDLYTYLHISAAVSGYYAMFSAGASFDLEDE